MNLGLVFQSGDAVLITVFLSLIAMSIATWVIIILRVINLQKVKKSSHEDLHTVRRAESLEAAVELLKDSQSPIARLTRRGVCSLKRFDMEGQKMLAASLPKDQYLAREVNHGLNKQLSRMDSGLAILASVGATAPFIGLLGTVWGIYHALINISQSGQMSIAAVAGPIGEALVATAVGLFTAIPAVLAYNYFVRVNKKFTRYLNNFAHDLHLYLINGKEKE